MTCLRTGEVEMLFMIFGCVCSAVTTDADRSVELKNGVSVGGRKIAVKHAMHRAPFE